MTVTAAFCPLSLQPLRDQNDIRIVGGSIYVYAAGTTTLISTFADAAMDTANPNPLMSDGFGRIPPIYVGAGAYKIVAQDASGAQLFVVDNLAGGVDYLAQAEAAAQQAEAALAGAITGDVKFKHGAGVDAGWAILNGRTIGNGQTQATARANDDTKALFVYLWNGDGSLAVSGGRGVTATADFTASKTIALPDYRGRAPVGCDQMGADATAGIITAASTQTPNTPGSTLGIEAVTLAQAHLPNVSPAITLDGGQPGGTHAHTGATDAQGSHSHGGQTVNAGAHTHAYTGTQNNDVSIQNGTGLANSGTVAVNTSIAGDHVHTINADGVHTHGVTIAASGAHSHTALIAPLGSGNAHPNVQPGILGYFHIKL